MESERDDKIAQNGDPGGRKLPLLSKEDNLIEGEQDAHLEIKAARKREQNRKAQIKYRLFRENDQDFKNQQNLKRRQKRLSLTKEELEIKRRKDAIKRRKYRKDPTSDGGSVFIQSDSCDIKTEHIDEYPDESPKPAVDQNYDDSNSELVEIHDIKIEETNLNDCSDFFENKKINIQFEQNEYYDLKTDTTNNIVEKPDEDSIEKIKARKRELNRKYQLKHRLSKKNDIQYIKHENLRRKRKRLSLPKEELEERRKKEAVRQRNYRLLKKHDDYNNEGTDGIKQKNSSKEDGETININNDCDSQSLGVNVDNLISNDNYHLKEEKIELNSNNEQCDFSDIKKDLTENKLGSINSAPTDGNSKEQNIESIEKAKKRRLLKHRLLKGQDYLKNGSLRRKKKRMSLSKEDLEKLRKKEALKRKILRSFWEKDVSKIDVSRDLCHNSDQSELNDDFKMINDFNFLKEHVNDDTTKAKHSQHCEIVYSDTEKQEKEDFTENENLENNFDECYIYDIETGQIVANLEDDGDREDQNNQDVIDLTTNDSNRTPLCSDPLST